MEHELENCLDLGFWLYAYCPNEGRIQFFLFLTYLFVDGWPLFPYRHFVGAYKHHHMNNSCRKTPVFYHSLSPSSDFQFFFSWLNSINVLTSASGSALRWQCVSQCLSHSPFPLPLSLLFGISHEKKPRELEITSDSDIFPLGRILLKLWMFSSISMPEVMCSQQYWFPAQSSGNTVHALTVFPWCK